MNENFRRNPIEATGQAKLIRRLPVILTSLLLLASCAAQPGRELPPLTDWETRQQLLVAIQDWAFTGRIGVSAGTEGFNGKLRWQQRHNGFSATISGPFGAGAVRLNGDDQHVTVIGEDNEVIELENPEVDLRDRYGWTIPVTSLRYWALGIPDPTSPATTEFGDDGQLAIIEQGNWRVSINQYRESGGQLMPRRITAVSGAAKVRLVIDHWIFFK